MATTVAQLMATLGLDSSNFEKGIDHAQNKGQGFQKTMLGLSAVGGGILAAGMATAAAGAVILGKELFNDVQIAADAQKVQSQLEAVLKSTGGVSGVTADKANELATALSQVTMFDDEAVLSGENMLLTFTNIGKDVFPQATETILDMSQALGQDLQSSAVQLGKALNDPVKGATALQRVGVTFTEDQKEQIKVLQESGDIMGAQKVILAELSKEFGGSAKAAGETFAGKMTILKNTIDNVRESVGAKLIPIIQKLIEYFVKIFNSPEFQQFLNSAVDGIIKFVDAVATNIPKFIEGFKKAFQWLADNKPVVIGILAALGVAVLAFAVTSAIAIWTAMAPLLPVIAIMAIVGLAAYALYRMWTENFGGIQEKTKIFFDWLKKTWDTIWNALLPVFKYFQDQFRSLSEAWQALVSGDFYTFGQKIREIWDRFWAALTTVVNSVEIKITGAVRKLITNVISFFRNTNWSEVGANILRGIVSGMNMMQGWVSSQIRKLAQNIISTFKGFFGIKSPSALMESIIGKNLALGINEGFANNLALSPVSVMGEVQAVSSGAFSGNGSSSRVEELLEKIANKTNLDERKMALMIRDAVAQLQVKK